MIIATILILSVFSFIIYFLLIDSEVRNKVYKKHILEVNEDSFFISKIICLHENNKRFIYDRDEIDYYIYSYNIYKIKNDSPTPIPISINLNGDILIDIDDYEDVSYIFGNIILKKKINV